MGAHAWDFSYKAKVNGLISVCFKDFILRTEFTYHIMHLTSVQ